MKVVSQREFEIVINNSDLEESVKKQLIENSKPFYELSNFIEKKYQISPQGSELMLQIHLSISLEKLGDKAFEKDEKELVSEMLIDYAKKHGFENYDGLVESFYTLTRISGSK
jgi:hypothetical protein